MSDAAFAALDAHIARIRKLPGLAKEAAPDVAQAVRDELERQIAAGVDPDGKPWKAREDGEQPLRTAANSLAVVAVGPRIFARLTGHVARHHRGRAKGGIERPILPTGPVPPAMGRAIARVLAKRFAAHMGGA
jgi:hypothetical protein